MRTKGLCEINIAGDINIDLLKTRDNKVKQYSDFLRRIGLKNMIQQVTHIKQQELGYSLIDHYLTTDDNLYNTTGTLPTNASDHFLSLRYGKNQRRNTKKVNFGEGLIVDWTVQNLMMT